MTGWSARALKGLARAEQALLLAAHSTQSRVNWASIAAEAGYADQSHLCRELRRYTGFSPMQLWRRVPNDEDLWVYKAWFGWNRACDHNDAAISKTKGSPGYTTNPARHLV